MSEVITTGAGDRYHTAADCPALPFRQPGGEAQGYQLHVNTDPQPPQRPKPQAGHRAGSALWGGRDHPEQIGYTVAMYNWDGTILPFPEGSDVFPTRAEAENYCNGYQPNARYRYIVVALALCEETP